MKKLHLFLATLIAITLFSCENDDENTSPEMKLIGKWELLSMDITSNGTTESLPNDCFSLNTLEFTTDNKLISITSETIEDITIGTNGEPDQTTITCGDPTSSTLPWTLSENIISVTNDFGVFDATILELTNNTLKLEQDGGNIKVISTYTKL